MTQRRVVITGLGAVSCIGGDVPTIWNNVKAGKGGIGPITHFDTEGHTATIAGEVRELDVERWADPKEIKRMDRYSQFAMVAAAQAMEDSGFSVNESNSEMVGVVIGSGIGGITTLETEHEKYTARGPKRVSPLLVPMMIGDMGAGLVAIRYNAKGPNMDIVSACASGAHSVGEAFEMIRRGDADMMIAGGAEAPITKLTVAGFASMKALSTRNDDPGSASRPFDLDRDGFVMSEGAGVVILEEYESAKARGARIYGELAGYGATADAYHMTHPALEGEGTQRAMKMAMKKAGVNPSEVDYINAHGTSTPLNDKYESIAIEKVFGDRAFNGLTVSSTKSMTGHLLGAAGPLELVISAMAMQDNVIPPTINYQTPDPECRLDYVPNEARSGKLNVILSNSLGFGGHNACLLLRRV
ncbi:MAG: beta-ketoacyl-[acyl-carrier-protein] synthase II [Candidatus Wallbacteria bacterium HGW-Wallbacteria-1]|jgi:3-oxoacyl-[acyl-carrier-protein] synthase II|uniref:3-oxoacyl-[acyl-carrier-protein] synthase 2 n=1 Tax=Candidatus Wallbacteria bacterium HGW-Wallbacteria-1 TaxID=2013854 RepID=A0A2N1PTI3_9BACT|nr:MAG: beta-ketoacyl-[acyl-carrier-protein] synthase II [Candidatus Wallbacteria bacterium HGW-Wallbacteria-1]